MILPASSPGKFIAHIREQTENAILDFHPLEDHLIEVSKIASSFLSGISSQWLILAGKWHDLGKYQPAFQEYIRKQSGIEQESAHIEGFKMRVTHSTAGAIHAVTTLGNGYGHLLGYLIAGHHAGLPDWSGGRGSLSSRLANQASELEYSSSLQSNIPSDVLSGSVPGLPSFSSDPEEFRSVCALWLRMMFSALVDADFLDTEAYMNPGRSKHRRKGFPALSTLQGRFYDYMQNLILESESSPLNMLRQKVYQSCIHAAKKPAGVFSLTVPTGGGKTLSSLGFAMEYARLHNKSRIIYSIPFTSIIEQNAAVFRTVLGKDAVLEHHCNMDRKPGKETGRSRLASENWDAPLVVTTNVQLFESLHAAHPGRCRKLHNLENAVIILDEAQQIPRDFHAPIVCCMKQLNRFFGVTWLLCSATQPDFSPQYEPITHKTLLDGFEDVVEICEDPIKLASQLKRVEVVFPEKEEVMHEEMLAKQLMEELCVLAIVNTRRQARTLFQHLPQDENSFHLSAQMCPEHRGDVLNTICERLANRRKGIDERPMRVISTQVVEAGVDVDFPVVYRAMAGLDSIVQSAGRCNREGKLGEPGRVIVFDPPELAPAGYLRQSQSTTRKMLKNGELANSLSPETLNSFFRQLNLLGNRDRYNINTLLTVDPDSSTGAPKIQFREAAKKFRLVDDNGIAVIVPYRPRDQEESPVYQWLALLETDASNTWIYRKLQRYTVTLPENFVSRLKDGGILYEKAGQWLVEECYYDDHLGVLPPDTLLDAFAQVV